LVWPLVPYRVLSSRKLLVKLERNELLPITNGSTVNQQLVEAFPLIEQQLRR
jgi:hypothetical protein